MNPEYNESLLERSGNDVHRIYPQKWANSFILYHDNGPCHTFSAAVSVKQKHNVYFKKNYNCVFQCVCAHPSPSVGMGHRVSEVGTSHTDAPASQGTSVFKITRRQTRRSAFCVVSVAKPQGRTERLEASARGFVPEIPLPLHRTGRERAGFCYCTLQLKKLHEFFCSYSVASAPHFWSGPVIWKSEWLANAFPGD